MDIGHKFEECICESLHKQQENLWAEVLPDFLIQSYLIGMYANEVRFLYASSICQFNDRFVCTS